MAKKRRGVPKKRPVNGNSQRTYRYQPPGNEPRAYDAYDLEYVRKVAGRPTILTAELMVAFRE